MLQLTAGTTWKSTNLLALEHPPYGEVLQLSGSPEIHFLFNPLSMRIDRRYAELERRGYLTRLWPCPINSKTSNSRSVKRSSGRGMPFPLTVRLTER